MSDNKLVKKFSIRFDSGTNRCQILTDYADNLDLIILSFSVDNDASFYMERYGYKVENSKLSVVNNVGWFEAGLFPMVYTFIKQIYPECDLTVENKTELTKFLFPLRGFSFDIKNISKDMVPRYYQTDAVKACLNYGRGLIESPTGSGKSFIIGNLIHNMLGHDALRPVLRHVLIYVPTRQLVDQFYTDLLDYGFNPKHLSKFTSDAGKKRSGTFSDNSCSGGFNRIIITNRDWVNSHPKSLPVIDLLICDEVHKVSPDSTSHKFIRKLKTHFKFGFTGTLPKNDYNFWVLIGLFGKEIYNIPITDLQEQGHLAALEITSISVKDMDIERDKDCLFHLYSNIRYDGEDTSDDALAFNAAYNAEMDYISENAVRLYTKPLNFICNQKNNNVLILFDRLEFGKALYEYMNNTPLGYKIHYVDGSTPINDRTDIVALLEKTGKNILFAQSTTFSTGINIKNLDSVGLFFLGKGNSKIIQSIGRILRVHKDKPHASLYDVSFNFKYSNRHKNERMSIYKEAYDKYSYDSVERIQINVPKTT